MRTILLCVAALQLPVELIQPATACAADPWADAVVHYDPGLTPAPGFVSAGAALGSPARFTPDPNFPGVVSIFSPAFLPSQLASIGEGGQLVVAFEEPIYDDPANAFGIDLLIFGNGGLGDFDYPNGQTGTQADAFFSFGLDPHMRVEVSSDGIAWVSLGTFVEGLFPTQAYLDSGPYDAFAGIVPTCYTEPVDPALSLADFENRSLADLLALYDGSGGGTPIDVAGAGLPFVQFVRISVLDDGDALTELNVEIDALATVPEPTAGMLFIFAVALARLRRGGVR